MRNSEEGFTFGDFTAEEWEKYFSNSLAQIGNIPPVEFLFNFNYSDDEERVDNFLAGDSSTHVSSNDSSAAAKNVTAGLEDSGVEVGQESEQETSPGKLVKTTAGASDCLPEAKQKQVKQSSEKTIQSSSEHIVFGGNSIKEHEQDVRQSKPESPSRTSATDVDQFPPLSLTVNTQRAVEKTETERSRKRRKRRRQRKRSGSVSSSSSECSEKERASVNSNGSGLKGKAVASLPTTDKVVLSDDVKEASKVQVNVLSARLKEQKSDALSNTDKRTAVQRKSTSSCDGDTVEERKSSLSTEGTSNSPVYSDTDIKVTVSISTAQDPLSSNQTYENLEKEHEGSILVDQSVKTSGAPEEITGRKDQPPKPSSWADLFKNSAKPLPGIVVKTVSPVVRNEMQTTSNPKKTDDTLQIPVTVEEDKFAKKFAESIQRQELQYIQKPYIPRGLINRGNWCYINAVSFKLHQEMLDQYQYLGGCHLWCPVLRTTMKVVSHEELKKHNSEGDVWMAIHGLVYDVSKFMPDHPGGAHLLQDVAGRDASGEFEDALHSEQARAEEAIVLKGMLEGCEQQVEGHRGAGWTEDQGIPNPEVQEAAKSSASQTVVATVLLVGTIGAALAAFAFLRSRKQ